MLGSGSATVGVSVPLNEVDKVRAIAKLVLLVAALKELSDRCNADGYARPVTRRRSEHQSLDCWRAARLRDREDRRQHGRLCRPDLRGWTLPPLAVDIEAVP